ncbi:MAG: gliding motility-associated C-terminal domain-containing protein [Ferruginibacter sp.]
MKLFCFFILIITSLHSNAQSFRFSWVKQVKGAGIDGGKDVAIDAQGNVYTTGFFSGTADFDPGPNVFNLMAPPENEEDIFILKLDSAGNFIWARQISGSFLDNAYSIATDITGDIYLTGIFFSRCDFDPGPATHFLSSSGNEDAFVLKLTSQGNFSWVKTYGAASFDRGNALTADNNGNVFITGYFKQTVDFNPGIGNAILTSTGEEDVFVLKLSSYGNFIFVKQFSGLQIQGGYSIKVGASGNIYVAGIFLGQGDFNPSVNNYLLQSTGLSDVFVCKLSADGDFIWARKMGGDKYMFCQSLELDNQENVILTGYFDGEIDVDPGPLENKFVSAGNEDIFICKLDANGILVWAKQLGGAGYESGMSVATDAAMNIYVTGYYQQALDLDPGPANHIITSAGISDIFIMRLTPDGSFVTGTSIGGPLSERPNSIKLDASGNIYTTGYFSSSVDFGLGQVSANLTSAGETDIFIHKIKQCENNSTFNLAATTCKGYTLNDKYYDSSGIYTQVLNNARGCDSIITLNLVITRLQSLSTKTICEGERFYIGGQYPLISGRYADTLTSVNNCDSIAFVDLTVLPSPKPDLGPDRNLCSGDSLILQPGNFASYTWNTGNTGATIQVNQKGIYWVRVTNPNGCVATDSFIIKKLIVRPANFLPPSFSLCSGDAKSILVQGYSTYLWSTGETGNTVTIRQPGIYSLFVTDEDNCFGKDSITVIENATCLPLAFPSSFTPNGDGKNDVFRPVIQQEVSSYSFLIFNRFGQKIFESHKINEGWDGRRNGQPADQGTYVYYLSFRNGQNELWNKSGSFLLLR